MHDHLFSRIGAVLAAWVLAFSTGCHTGIGRESLFGVESPDELYWKGYYRDASHVLSRPRRWTKRDWLVLSGVDLMTIVVGFQDAHLRNAVLGSGEAAGENLAFFGEKLGDLGTLCLGLPVAYGLAWAFDDPKLKEASLLAVECIAFSGAATQILKHAIGRERPYLGSGPAEFHGPSIHEGWDSFPSSHATLAFATATAFHLEYRKAWVSVLAYSLATLTGWSRMHDDMHWASDVFAGAALGIIVTKAVFRARRVRSR